ncbi:MAG: PorT family protein [Candidatus Symbiothrix sp.]|jgi:hypothetical protein|nr:PorT family protein [Candidatus Symbiothrix sp.]
MKKFFLSLVLCSIAAASFAQLPIKFGATAGLNVSNATISSGSISISPDWKAGFQVGVIADLAITPQISILPELIFSQKGYKSSYSEDGGSYTESSTVNYLTLPVNVAYKFDLGTAGTIFPFAGPYVGYALSGSWKEEWKDGDQSGKDSEKIKIGSGDDDDIKALDFGVNVGVGYQFENYLFRLQYNIGLSNIANVPSGYDASLKTKNLAVSVGYFF